MSRTDGRPRVVVTGLGLITPIGIGREATWQAALAGTSGAGPITLFDASDSETTFACEVRGFDANDHIDRRSARRMDRFCHFGVAAARMALEDARLEIADADRMRAGAIVGSGIGGLHTFDAQTAVVRDRGPDRASPLFIPMVIANMAAAQVSMTLGLKGPLSCTTTACASGNHAIGEAAEAIRRDQADVMLAGGAEATITKVGIAAFNAMRALSTRNDDPSRGSRPFDAGRDGFVMGEAGAILVLERLEHAVARGAHIYCEMLGYGLTGDAHHVTEPDPTGEAPAAAIRLALRDAGVEPDEVDHVNAHATSTPVGDPNEVKVMRMALGDAKAAATPVTSTKSMTGHCLGAAGGVEAALTALAIQEGMIPPTINLDDRDPACAGVDLVANTARRADVRVAMSNAFGFGGHNAAIVLGRVDDQ